MGLTDTSRFLSLILRHKPETIGISLDEHGWADVEELLDKMSKTRPIDRETLEEIVRTDSKQRYSFNADHTCIRANQGYSIPVDVELPVAVPPEYLYHGTGRKYESSIEQVGLISKSRLYVHLSEDTETAEKVGRRHGIPVIYRVCSGQMQRDGYTFYRSVNGVWLTKAVPVAYLEPCTKNRVILIGRISSSLRFSHATDSGRYYIFHIEVPRKSSNTDNIPVVVKEGIVDITGQAAGTPVAVIGTYRSHNRASGRYPKKFMYVHADTVAVEGTEEYAAISQRSSQNNSVHLEGTVCKDVICRRTPSGKEITEILLAVARDDSSRSDYLNCIAWHNEARAAAKLKPGDKVSMDGRVQSRSYRKQTGENGEYETRVAYEISVAKLEVGWKEDSADKEGAGESTGTGEERRANDTGLSSV